MKLKIRCDYKKQKLQIVTDANHFSLVTLILNVFNRPKKSRYSFLLELGLLLVLLASVAPAPVCYDEVRNLQAITPAIVLLAYSICKQGPPAAINLHSILYGVQSSATSKLHNFYK